MKRKIMQSLTLISIGLILSFIAMPARAQNSNTSGGEMRTSGSEMKRAGKTGAHYMKHGRVFRAGKHFGKHTGRAGKHFGRGTKKAVKHIIS